MRFSWGLLVLLLAAACSASAEIGADATSATVKPRADGSQPHEQQHQQYDQHIRDYRAAKGIR
jgi:outer membrane biogenesis lipoprotein LolB